ncbi:hypothetical protein ACVWZK_002447 [Bradyrhizobium sp. GM0.4]
MAISGTVASCTNQASMPPGEVKCWIFAAACDGETVASASAAPVAKENATRRRKG